MVGPWQGLSPALGSAEGYRNSCGTDTSNGTTRQPTLPCHWGVSTRPTLSRLHQPSHHALTTLMGGSALCIVKLILSTTRRPRESLIGWWPRMVAWWTPCFQLSMNKPPFNGITMCCFVLAILRRSCGKVPDSALSPYLACVPSGWLKAMAAPPSSDWPSSSRFSPASIAYTDDGSKIRSGAIGFPWSRGGRSSRWTRSGS